MKPWILLAVCGLVLSSPARARVVSPRSVEVRFRLAAEFETRKEGEARALALDQAKFLFAYLQNPSIVHAYGLDRRLEGIGAPRWEPGVEILRETRGTGGLRRVSYRMQGKLLLLKEVAAEAARRGYLDVELPYRLDDYFDAGCVDAEHPEAEGFWYFADVLQPGCEKLRRAPLARPVRIEVSPAPAVPANLRSNLAALRGDNGNGDLFEIMAINGFDESSTKRQDDGRVNFETMNAWFRAQGFAETVVSRFKNRPVHVFEKTLTRADGSRLDVRVTRLLADTDLDGSTRVTFAKFLKKALETSDVVIYEGHSGMGANLDLETIEKRLLLSKDKNVGDRIELDRRKHQLFFFDACSSYSYYLGMFDGRKDPGTLAVMSNGLASLFGFEIPMTKRLYQQLISVRNDDLTWQELLENVEVPLRGNSFLLNVDVNDE